MCFKCNSVPSSRAPGVFFLPAAALVVSAWLSARPARAAESPLAIVNAGVQQYEDGPFVSATAVFLPEDTLYFTFQIAGFKIESNEAKGTQQISLAYEISVLDANGVALAPSNSGKIDTQLSAEDKNWTPKRRASFLIPQLVGAGDYRVHAVAKDLLGKAETAKDIPFHIGGVEVHKSEEISVEHFRFLREENSREPLGIAAYRPGDTVFTAFEIAGYALGPGNRYHVAYGATVLRPDGKPFLEKPEAVELDSSSFYPAQFLPGSFNVVCSPDSQRGQYVIVLTARDLIANRTYVTKQLFSLE